MDITQRAARVVGQLAPKAAALDVGPIGSFEPEHVLTALQWDRGGLAWLILLRHGLQQQEPDFAGSTLELRPSTRTERLLEIAERFSTRWGHGYLGTEHLILGLPLIEGPAAGEMRAHGLDADATLRAVEQLLAH